MPETTTPAPPRVRTRSQARLEAALPPGITPKIKPKDKATTSTNTRKPRVKHKATTRTATVKRSAQPRTKATTKPSVLPPGSSVAQRRPFTRSVATAQRANEAALNESKDASIPLEANQPVDDAANLVLQEQRRIAFADLEQVPTVDGACLKNLYANIISDQDIKNFLVASSLYDYTQGCWTGIHQTSENAAALHNSFAQLIEAIIAGLGDVSGTREVVDTRGAKLFHVDEPAQFSSPDMAIKATGPSFAEPKLVNAPKRAENPIGFSNVASVFTIKRDADVSEADVDHLAVYNRQIFFRQLNRLFCRSLLITETQVRLLHCDRSGAYKTTALNINDNPHTFVRLILGLSSTQEAILGIDISVQWTIKDGVKVAGTIRTLDASGEQVTYDLRMDRPCAITHDVCGKGTVCWMAKDPDGKEIIIKDAWRVDEQVPEYTLLERAKGLPGVVNMIAYEDVRVQTKNLRPESFVSDGFCNRTMSRVTMTCYGLPLYKFTSQKQAIAAIRDAIQGHLNLLRAGVLHSDVSMDNILLGEEGSDVGHRGVLIDLDMARRANGPAAEKLEQFHGGTRLYLSICLLDQISWPAVPRVPRDYLDDVESFFYVLCHLLYGYEGVNSPAPDAFRPGSNMARWEQEDTEAATNRKYMFVMCEGPKSFHWDPPPLFWASPCIELCDKFRKYILPMTETKREILFTSGAANRRTMFEKLYGRLDQHYTDIIALFDEALDELGKPGGEAPRRGDSESPSCSSSGSAETASFWPTFFPRKREFDDVEGGEVGPSKRICV